MRTSTRGDARTDVTEVERTDDTPEDTSSTAPHLTALTGGRTGNSRSATTRGLFPALIEPAAPAGRCTVHVPCGRTAPHPGPHDTAAGTCPGIAAPRTRRAATS